MASAMRKMAVYLGLVEDDGRYEKYDEYDEYEEYEAEPEQAPAAPVERPSRGATALREEPRAQVTSISERVERSPERAAALRPVVPVAPVVTPRPAEPAETPRITTLHPRTYNEARGIGEHFRDGTPVIMNLTEMDDVDAKRLVDFAAGLIFGLHGTIERVTNKVFLLSPVDVHIATEEKARMAENGFFNQS